MSLSICLQPDEVERRFDKLGIPCRFSPEELNRFNTTPVVDAAAPTLMFPTPGCDNRLTLSFIRSCVGTDPLKPPSFFDHPWYAEESFMSDSCPPGWHVLHRDVLDRSIGRSSDYAGSLGAGLALPLAVEVVLMLFLHYAGTGEQLLTRKHTWCADMASGERRVTVGAFGRNGLFLSSHPQNFASRGLGILPRVG